jgi:hypothetical protein
VLESFLSGYSATDIYFGDGEYRIKREPDATGDPFGPIANIVKALERLERVDGFVGAVLDVNVQGKLVFPLADELSRRNIPFVFSTGYDNSFVPPEYSSIRRFSKPADDREVAAALLEAVQRSA